jgi:hypothetical protein
MYTFFKQIESGEWKVMDPQFMRLAAKDVKPVAEGLARELNRPVRVFRELRGGLGRLVLEVK